MRPATLCYVGLVLGWRRVLAVAAVDGVFFLLSGLTAHSVRHSGTISNVLWTAFLLGVLALIGLLAVAIVRSALALRR